MIDFRLSDNDRKRLDLIRQQALICREHARHFDEHEDEFAPEVIDEAVALGEVHELRLAPAPDDCSMPVMAMLATMGQMWGDYTVRARRPRGALGNAALSAAGTDDQKARWGGENLAMAITEPGCGSDPSQVQTSAVLDPATDEWVLNGEKIFVTTGCRATGAVVWATIDKSAGRAGIKSFLVLKDTPGFVVAHKEKKLGIRADDTATYVFENCRIPRDHLLGGDESVAQKGSGGFRGVMKTFNMTRPATAAFGLGITEAALDFTREQLEAAGIELDYGAGLGRQSALADRFLRLEAYWQSARLNMLNAVWLAGEAKPNNLESSVCKAHAGNAVRQVIAGCIDLLGPLGVSREHLIEKWMRDSRIVDIYEGTGQIQRLIVARGLLDYTREELN
ncbi:MAG: acyl-CoA dehydrogenase family protein [Myxococcota bacterium]|nr:acyl-CoA dehydrogenase family protein [Myxococcales bacterium]